jgi:hypothetical protein
MSVAVPSADEAVRLAQDMELVLLSPMSFEGPAPPDRPTPAQPGGHVEESSVVPGRTWRL